jgi:hypothetical protein
LKEVTRTSLSVATPTATKGPRHHSSTPLLLLRSSGGRLHRNAPSHQGRMSPMPMPPTPDAPPPSSPSARGQLRGADPSHSMFPTSLLLPRLAPVAGSMVPLRKPRGGLRGREQGKNFRSHKNFADPRNYEIWWKCRNFKNYFARINEILFEFE